MLDAAREAVALAAGKSRASLETDRVLALALWKLIEIVGEAAKNVSQATESSAPAIPWRKLAGTRDRLTHAYFEVNLDIVWRIATEDFPRLVTAVEAVLGGGPPCP